MGVQEAGSRPLVGAARAPAAPVSSGATRDWEFGTASPRSSWSGASATGGATSGTSEAGSLPPVGEYGGMRGRVSNWGVRLTTSSLAAVAGLALLGAAFSRRSRANAVWEWADIATARVALVVGVISVLGCVGIAASPSRVTSIRYSRLLAAQVVLAGIAAACALVLLRSGAWLMHVRAVPVP